MNVIEALKKNEKPFGLMSEEMQEKAKKIGWNSFQYYHRDGHYRDVRPDGFVNSETYRLRQDYKEEPEVVKCPISKGASESYSGLLIYINLARNSLETLLCSAPNEPDFIGFLYEDGRISPLPRIYSDNTGVWFVHEKGDIVDWELLTPTHVLFRKKT